MTQIPTPTVLEYISWLESNLTKWVWNVSTDDEVENKFKSYIGRVRHAGSGFFYLLEKECTIIGCGCSEGEEEE